LWSNQLYAKQNLKKTMSTSPFTKYPMLTEYEKKTLSMSLLLEATQLMERLYKLTKKEETKNELTESITNNYLYLDSIKL
jgi:hypothetical protein